MTESPAKLQGYSWRDELLYCVCEEQKEMKHSKTYCRKTDVIWLFMY